MAKHPTTAQVILHARNLFNLVDHKRHKEYVTPEQVVRFAEDIDDGMYEDVCLDERQIVHASAIRALKSEHHLRNVGVTVHSNKEWTGHGDNAHGATIYQQGTWHLTDGEACLNAARSLEESSL